MPADVVAMAGVAMAEGAAAVMAVVPTAVGVVGAMAVEGSISAVASKGAERRRVVLEAVAELKRRREDVSSL